MNIPSNINIPVQRKTLKEKLANDSQWGKDSVDALTISSVGGFGETDDYKEKLSDYRLFNNIVDQEEFEQDFNPLGIEIGQFKDKIHAYNKTPTKIQVILGEELERPFNFRTTLINADGIKSKMFEKDRGLRELAQQDVLMFMDKLMRMIPNYANASSQERRQMDVELDKLASSFFSKEEFDSYSESKFLASKEHLANQVLRYLVQKLYIKDKMNDGFKHGLISGDEIIWVGAINGEPDAKIINSLHSFYYKDQETKFIQDGYAAGHSTMMSASSILSLFADMLSEDQKKRIEEESFGILGKNENVVGPQMTYQYQDHFDRMSRLNVRDRELGSYGENRTDDLWLVVHVEWVSQKKIYFVSAMNEYGEEEKSIVDENFVIPEYAVKRTVKNKYSINKTTYEFDGLTVEPGWIPEVWEGYKIGDMHCGIRPKPYQCRSVDNPYKVKLGYHGVTYSAMNARSVSLMRRMRPFQNMIFVAMHKLRKLIARDRGTVYSIDVSMINPKMGLEKTLYYLNEMDLDIFNSLQNSEKAGAAQRSGKSGGTVDRSNMRHILNYVSLLNALDEQLSDVAGVNRQREGQVRTTEAVTNAMSNIQQSALITEAAYFQPHLKLWESVLNSLLQTAQACWKGKSIVKQFVLDDLSLATLELNPSDLDNADFGVFVTNAARENELFTLLKQLSQALIQNDKAKMSDIIKMYKATSSMELADLIENSEKHTEQLQQQEMSMQRDLANQQIEAQREDREDRQEHEKQLELLRGQIQIMLEEARQGDPSKSEELEIKREELDKKFKVEEEKIRAQKDIAKIKSSKQTT